MFGVKTGYGQNLWKQLAWVGQPEGGVIGLGSQVCPGQESKSIMDGAGLGARAVGRSLPTGTPPQARKCLSSLQTSWCT